MRRVSLQRSHRCINRLSFAADRQTHRHQGGHTQAHAQEYKYKTQHTWSLHVNIQAEMGRSPEGAPGKEVEMRCELDGGEDDLGEVGSAFQGLLPCVEYRALPVGRFRLRDVP